MKRLFVLVLLCASVLAQSIPQNPADDPVNGEFEDGLYSNSRYGFEFKIPTGWTVAPEENLRSFEATHTDGGAGDLRLLVAVFRFTSTPGNITDAIVIGAAKVGGNYGVSLNGGMAYFKAKRSKLKGSEIIRPAAPFLLGGLEVAREDVRSKQGGQEEYTSNLAIVIRDRLISFQVSSLTAQGVEEGLRQLAAGLQFEPDWMSRNNPPPANDPAVRVRISQSELLSLLDKKVTPELPGDLTPTDIKVPIQMHLLVSSDGAVEKIWVFEGSPDLSWPAVAAVRQWHFRPYLQNGKPVPVESTLTVDFR